MLDLKGKYAINIKTSQQTYTIKSILKPNLSQFDFTKVTMVWFRQPPPPYEIEEMPFNCNQTIYKCNSLDYECSIICKVFGENGVELSRFDYGPIETFFYNKLSPNLQLRVQVLLFGNLKKCVLAFNPAPLIINVQNNNKYQLTQQDIRSIYLKPQIPQDQQTSKQKSSDQLAVLNNQLKKTIVIQNLFQRLILLKLFHQIPNGMYCHSVQVLQISFYDESSCSMALLALNRFKYQKRELSEFSKSMYNPNQESYMSKLMKRSNDSLSNLGIKNNTELPSFLSHKNVSQESIKKQFLPLSAFTSWRKSPKQSINSGQQSIVSGNSSKVNQSRMSLRHQKRQLNKTQGQNQDKQAMKYPESYSRLTIKQPKISVPSTDINSNKEPRQKKVSFPETPTVHNLKSSELILKSNEFKLCLSLRRSQQEIKTPRMDVDEQEKGKTSNGCPNKKKTTSVIEEPKQDQNNEQNKYVNEFENLLFEVDGDEDQDNKEKELCLNDSFARMEQEEEKQKLERMQLSIKVLSTQGKHSKESPIISSLTSTKQQQALINLKETLETVLRENYELKQKNQQLKKEIQESNSKEGKISQISKYEEEIQKLKQMQQLMNKQIEVLKISSTSLKNNDQDMYTKKSSNHSPQKTIVGRLANHQAQEHLNRYSDYKPDFLAIKKIDLTQYKGVISPQRRSKHENQGINRYAEPTSPTFGARRSQDYNYACFNSKQFEGKTLNESNVNNLDSVDRKFMQFQNDPDYQKFRNNQSYSYKATQYAKFNDQK